MINYSYYDSWHPTERWMNKTNVTNAEQLKLRQSLKKLYNECEKLSRKIKELHMKRSDIEKKMKNTKKNIRLKLTSNEVTEHLGLANNLHTRRHVNNRSKYPILIKNYDKIKSFLEIGTLRHDLTPKNRNRVHQHLENVKKKPSRFNLNDPLPFHDSLVRERKEKEANKKKAIENEKRVRAQYNLITKRLSNLGMYR